MKKEKLFIRFQNFFEWSERANLAGSRLLDFSIEYKKLVFGGSIYPKNENADIQLLGALNRQLNSEVYFFSISFYNYLKSIERLGINIALERYKNSRILISALRNIFEHWENHDFDEFLKGKLNKKSLKNFNIFLKKFPNSPATPFGITFSQNGEVTIASILSVVDALKVLESNKKLAEKEFNKIFQQS
jgi:hypothetical protein